MPDTDTIQYGPILVSGATGQVRRQGYPVHLTPIEYRLLCYLLCNQGRILPRDELLSAVWNFPPGTATRTLDIHIASLRKKLGLQQAIKTVNKKGYLLYPESERTS